jgi:GrpB-like predicted nucleotidyltransferase (UPF0157 family)
MPPPIRVEIEPYSATWPELAHQEIELLSDAFGGRVGGIHHIGSTSICGLAAKPVIDLMAVAPDLDFLDGALPELDRLGFRGWGELGITGRRYFTKDTDEGKRVVQLHCFPQGSPHVERHLAFRDYLRTHPDIASDYETEKRRCAALFPENSHSYSDCKAEWIIGAEATALRWYRGQRTFESYRDNG